MAEISKKLIEECRLQKSPAQGEMFRLLSPKLMGICYRYSGSRENAEDILQEAFVLIFTKIDLYKETGSFEGWAKRITVNSAINWLRKKKNLVEQIELGTKHDKGAPDEENFDHFPMQVDELMRYIAVLPAGYRTILNMYAVEGFSHKEIAEQLGINESTSRSQYVRGKKILLNMIDGAKKKMKYEEF